MLDCLGEAIRQMLELMRSVHAVERRVLVNCIHEESLFPGFSGPEIVAAFDKTPPSESSCSGGPSWQCATLTRTAASMARKSQSFGTASARSYLRGLAQRAKLFRS